jgi:hypothetical protein
MHALFVDLDDMARNRQRKTDRQPPSAEQMKLAVTEVVQNGCKLKTTAVK